MSLENKFDQLKGSVKEGLGKLTGNEKLQAEGFAEKVVSKVKEAAEDAFDGVKNVASVVADKAADVKDAVVEKAAELKDGAADKAEDVKRCCRR